MNSKLHAYVFIVNCEFYQYHFDVVECVRARSCVFVSVRARMP